MNQPDHIIEIRCVDPRHARGKVAKIATIAVRSDGTWSRVDRPPTRRIGRVERKVDSGQARDRDALLRSTMGTDPIACKLCGRHLPRYCGVQLGQVMRQLARDGVPTIRLDELAAIISKQEGR